MTQNSSVAFNGYLFGKPALLFRKADFHHIAVQAGLDNLAAGFAELKRTEPDYAAYLYWYWQDESASTLAGPKQKEPIAARLKTFWAGLSERKRAP